METNTEQTKVILRQFVRNEVRHNMIAEAAYYRAHHRSFQNGDPVGDWLVAEEEIDEKLMNFFLSFSLLPSLRRACYSDQGGSDRGVPLESFGLPTVVPPPEEKKDVQTFIGTERIEKNRQRFVSRSYMKFQYSE